jgi:hypothetical protein
VSLCDCEVKLVPKGKLRMKKALLALTCISGFSFGSAAWAHGTKSGMTAHAIQEVTKIFEKDHAHHGDSYLGIKGWPSGSKIIVRVYLTEDQTLKYSCTEVEEHGKESLVCIETPK